LRGSVKWSTARPGSFNGGWRVNARRRTARHIAAPEHPPVYTTGKRNAESNLRLPQELLGAPLVQTDRGGDITFHGPGQLVAYPIIDLREARLGVMDYVRRLEEVIIRTLSLQD
jgi:lipoate-protein ligase B